jgi:glycosyltransferase involved in cell wall biosynthesis
MIQISAVIITLNEAKNIGRCIESVKDVVDEIIVVDSYSTDATVRIARNHGATVIQREFRGYGSQKNFANAQSSFDWILSLDADEALSEELKESILKLKNNPDNNMYEFPRLTNYCGKWIKHCGWYPDKKVRLFNKTKGSWVNEIHERWVPDNVSDKIGELNGDLLHYSYYTISEHISRIDKFTELTALEALKHGRNSNLFKIWIIPKWNFFHNYIIRLGFLDGYEGYLICKISAFANFVKYNKIRLYASKKTEHVILKAQGTVA